MMRRLEQCGKPVVAAVNGFALGGGCELAMACHLRVASESARFGQPEAKLGIGPGYGGTVRLPRLVGRGRALELLLTGAMIDAQEAWRIGLVNRVVPADQLLPECERLIRTILENGPLAIRACLELGGRRPRDAGRRGAPARGGDLRPAQRHRRHARGHHGIPGQAEARLHRVLKPGFRACNFIFHPAIFPWFQGERSEAVSGCWLALVAGCTERDRPTFPTDVPNTPNLPLGPLVVVSEPLAADTVVTPGDVISIRGLATDPDGVGSVFFELEGVNFNLAPIDGRGRDTVGFSFDLSTRNFVGDTVVLRVYGIDVPGSQGDFVGRRFRFE